MPVDLITKAELKAKWEDVLKTDSSFKQINGVNPCLISLRGREFYIFAKNLSPAQLSNDNPNIWRVQLPIRDAFSPIKNSDTPFILVGYDNANDVCAIWNPHWVKQRLNVAKSVSFYSRLSEQKSARDENRQLRLSLKNSGEVLLFPREQLLDVIMDIDALFPDNSEYIALGSSKRVEANEAYRLLCDASNLKEFAYFLAESQESNEEIENAVSIIKRLISTGAFSSKRRLFMSCDSLGEYRNIIDEFISDTVATSSQSMWENDYAKCVRDYIEFLILSNEEVQGLEGDPLPDSTSIKEVSIELPETDSETIEESEVDEIIDWETPYIDASGKLTRIANPELIDLVRPSLTSEYPSTSNALAIVEEFYDNRFQNMVAIDWIHLLRGIDWNNPYATHSPSTNERQKKKSKTHTLKVTFPDGRILQHRQAKLTYVEVIKDNYPELISLMGIVHAGVNIVSDKLDAKYHDSQQEIEGGWYVMTNTTTEVKRDDLIRISDELELGLTVELVPLTENTRNYHDKESGRKKIRIIFPDGRSIQPNKASDALVEVVKFAGPERVQGLNIIVCKENIVIDHVQPKYKVACKPVGNGLYVNTGGDTGRKYDHIMLMNDSLQLGLTVSMV